MMKKRNHVIIIPNKYNSTKGFTLIELAMVLVVIGLLIGLGAGLIGPLTKRVKYNETKEIVDAAVESIVGYVASNKRIPEWGDYSPDTTIDEFIEVVKNPNDSWGKPLYYFFTDDLLTSDSICNRRTTNLTLCRDATCNSRISDIAFVVVSSSEDYNPQTGIVTTGCPGEQTCVGVYDVGTPNIDNCTNATDCPDSNYPANMDRISRPESYDDIVKWVTLNELRIKAGCVGPQLKILNNELPFGYENNSYHADIYADGGVPFTSGGKYRWCREGTGPSGLTFNPSILSGNCLSLDEGSWGQADNLTISTPPPPPIQIQPGSFKITFFVRDNNDPSGSNDNIAQKTLALTINPVLSTGCSSYRVWNDAGGRRDFLIDGTCKTINNNSEITSPETLDNGETINRYNTNNGTCGTLADSLTYSQAVADDTNKDCCVNFTGTDRTCP